ncbi:very-short-patch-repair endonuclease [Nocardioides luteus]|uniref:hypothetical protein n=1 Tax=Nocardioides luteus TaxID=1844 RepID=UPI0016641D7A|nr:hypothetical protein [Nocardioides luteus]MDR7311529.1 very-short-patch-repair endonuclease [Nocardioides luteus]
MDTATAPRRQRRQRQPRRRGPRWERIGNGVYVPSGLDGDARWRAGLAAWAEVLPDSTVFTGLTAMRLRGLWLPPPPDDLPTFVAVHESSRRIRRPELRVSRHPQPPAAVLLDDLRVAPVAEAALACARDLGVLDLVVLLDSALHLKKCTLADLEDVATSGRPGSRRLSDALRWCDGRAESAWESLLRILHTACGVEVEPQVDLRDAHGVFIGRADLLVTGTRTLQEYDGAQHRERGQYRRDRGRDAALAKSGYVRHGWVASQVIHDSWLILRTATDALGRDLSVDDIRPWWGLLEASLFSKPGTASMRATWRLPDL